MAANKIKILLFGSILDDSTFTKKLAALHASKAGPFDVAFVVGSVPSELITRQEEFPIPVYLQQPPRDLDDSIVEDENGFQRIANNLFVLQNKDGTAGIWNLPVPGGKNDLVVACCPPNFRVESAKKLIETAGHVSYVACDLLLTSEWPQGIEQLVSSATDISFDVADVALKLRARYHIVPSDHFVQTPAFQHLSSTTSTIDDRQLYGRLIALAPVSASQATKATKCVHALGLNPVHASGIDSNASQTLLPCPFTDAAYARDGNGTLSNKNAALSEASVRRILAEEKGKRGVERWSSQQKRPVEEIYDDKSTTIYVHGLHNDVSGRLQDNSEASNKILLDAFRPYGGISVRKPHNAPTSRFAFIEFSSHEAAKDCWQMGSIEVAGVKLSMRWADQQPATGKKRQRLTEQEAQDSSAVYFKVVNAQDIEKHTEALRKWMELTLEKALGDDGITADTEPALRVQSRPGGSNFGFLDFASHAAASMALASTTGSTDGGMAENLPEDCKGLTCYLHWAEAKKERDVIEDASGFRFERKHFPADSRHDCWFCLASEACEKHLITGVYDSCYAAMPKGPVDPGHVLLIPVQHRSEGALKTAAVAEEIEGLKQQLRQHSSQTYKKGLFVFERAIQTKGGYHTHVQCIPVDTRLGVKLQATMLAQAKRCGFELRELKSDLAISSVLDSEDDRGYFYVEVPVTNSAYKKFISLVPQEQSQSVPLQFGREVLAAVMGNPDLAHWKSCVLSTEDEAMQATTFRESFSKFISNP